MATTITRQHFEAVAYAFSLAPAGDGPQAMIKRKLAERVARALARFNGSFSYARFYDACMTPQDLALLAAIHELEA